jgi:hypothetical protein
MKSIPLKIRFFTVLTVALMLLGSSSMAQLDCDISIDAELPICPGGLYTLTVTAYEDASYRWTANGIQLSDTTSAIDISITEQTTYGVTVTDNVTSEECTDELIVTVRPEFTIDFIQRQLTCTNGDEANGNNAKVEAIAQGEFPPDEYTYAWQVDPIQIAPGTPSLAIGLKAHLFYTIEVTDPNGCRKEEQFWTEAFSNADIEVFSDPDTAYIQNPHITFSFVNNSVDSIQLSNFFWDFGDESATSELTTPTHTYQEEGEYNVVLTAYNLQGCDSVYTKSVLVRPVDLFIPNVFTPNGDGINDTFIITENQGGDDGDLKSAAAFEYEAYDVLNLYYEGSELVIFNRWGRIVYRSTNYKNDWDGENLPDGVYFYVLKCFGAVSDEVYKGSVSIYGSGR